jgi:SAM-dependent methyltransferase
MAENKNHWYDGWFYDSFIAPNQDKLFGQIKNLIEPGKNVIDVGCGTGRFSFSVSDKCKYVLGIDLSKRNIERANQTLSEQPNHIISFEHKNVSEIISGGKAHFDYAVMTYVIHEIDENERAGLLKELSLLADKIIIGDYLAPPPKGYWSILNKAVEFAAGKEHYNNFKNYVSKEGLNGLAFESGLEIVKEIKNIPSTSHIMILSKK